MSVKKDILRNLWPDVPDDPKLDHEHSQLRWLAQQRIGNAAVTVYCDLRRAQKAKPMVVHFADFKAATEAAYAAGERHKDGVPGTGHHSRAKAFRRGEEDRCIVDHYWGEGAYDSDFTTEEMVDEAMMR